MTLLEKILAAIKPSVKLVQTFAPLAPGPTKANAALALIGAFAGIGAATPLPGPYTNVALALIALTVQELQISGELVKDEAPK